MSKNLIAYQFNDDITIRNYMALLACILNPKLNYNTSLRIFDISNKNKLKIDSTSDSLRVFGKKYKHYRKIKVIDTFTNERLIFDSVYEAESYTGIKKENIYVYIPRNILGKSRYKFTYYND